MGKYAKNVRALITAVAVAAAASAGAVEWRFIGEGDWLGGARLKSPASLAGKVVLVDVWGLHCPPCRALLPRLQQTWEAYKHKPFILLGSHRQERNEEAIHALLKKNGITYPVYQWAGLVKGEPSNDGGIPFLYVLDHRGKVIYKGHSLPEATEAAVEAFDKVGVLPGLTDGVVLNKYKQLEGTLAIGKPIQTAVAQLKRGTGDKDPVKAEEAKTILGAIATALGEVKAEIDYLKESNPKEAVRLIKLMKVTWPEEAAAYKAEFSALVAAARDQVAAEKKPQEGKAAKRK